MLPLRVNVVEATGGYGAVMYDTYSTGISHFRNGHVAAIDGFYVYDVVVSGTDCTCYWGSTSRVSACLGATNPLVGVAKRVRDIRFTAFDVPSTPAIGIRVAG